MKAHRSFAELVSWVPLGGFLWLMLYAYLAYLQVGHWPRYARPDPTTVGPWLTGYALMGLLIAFLFATPVALAALIGNSLGRPEQRRPSVLVRRLGVFAV